MKTLVCVKPGLFEYGTGQKPELQKNNSNIQIKTGNLAAINNAFEYMAHGGQHVLIGLQKGNISFKHPEFHKREATLMSSRNATKDDFLHVIHSIKKGEVDPTTYITHRVVFEQVKEEFAGWLNPGKGVIKAMIQMD